MGVRTMLSDSQAVGDGQLAPPADRLARHLARPGQTLARHLPPARHGLARHLARGAVGFGLIGSALALTTSVGPASLLLFVPGMVSLRGCPTCWIVGLIETVSAGRLERTCTDAGCTLSRNQHGPFE
jgi:hypothetical protein